MSFQHDDAGVDESLWGAAFEERRATLPALDAEWLAGIGHLVVVAAHPDDETLGAVGLLAHAYRAGVRTSVLVATSGEASHPDSPTHTPAELARLREAECLAAVAEVDPGASVSFLRMPDGQLADYLSAGFDTGSAAPTASLLTDAIADLLRSAWSSGARTVVVSPWSGDRHPDHAAAAEATRRAADRARTEGHNVEVLAAPIWLWFWAEPGDPAVPWQRMRVLTLDDDAVAAKSAALAAHVTQVQPLSGLPGDEVLLRPGMLAHFERAFEVFVSEAPEEPRRPGAHGDATESDPLGGGSDDVLARPGEPRDGSGDTPTAPAERFDGGSDDALAQYFETLHGDSDDPWGFETRWYEERKRAILLAALPARDYASVLEVGCSTGVLTLDLVARVRDGGAVLGIDLSERAVERAQSRLSPHPQASAQRMRVPEEWPDGRFDLVVISEIGYYLDPDELTAVIERVLGSLTDDGALVLCHWRHPVDGRTETGDSVHAVARTRDEFDTVVHHEEEDFVLDVLERSPARSVARREGII